jgi:2-polyprenyl-3-methyl-5-hydroxy-6-metoxy-1,4-benzoquinol methylase
MTARIIEEHNEAQRAYFEATDKPRMRARDTPYVRRHVEWMEAFAQLEPGARVLDAGCGQGRFTLPLAARGHAVEGLDVAPVLLERLAAADGGRFGVPVHHADLRDPPGALHGRFDAVVGFFALHHLHDVAACLAGARRLVRPGGVVAFLEPNARCPLYYAQITLTPGMSFAGDGGLVRMRPAVLRSAYASAGLGQVELESRGFGPPALVNRPRGRGLDEAAARWTPPAIRPFLLVRGRRV